MSEQAEIKSGAETSEFKLTKVMVAIGTALQGFGAVLATLPQDTKWVAIAAAVCGTVLQVFSVLGYVKSRTQIKAAAVLAPPQTASASAQPSGPPSP